MPLYAVNTHGTSRDYLTIILYHRRCLGHIFGLQDPGAGNRSPVACDMVGLLPGIFAFRL